MTSRISRNVWTALTCSFCNQDLSITASGAQCPGCHLHYQYTPAGALDLRLQRAKKYQLEFEVGAPLFSDDSLQVEPLQVASKPAVNFTGMQIPSHMTRELMSYFPKARLPGSLMLDLACGSGVHRGVCERAGFEWVGADYGDTSKAPILADAHALPFKNEAFECILSVAAIQLFRNPFVMMKEAYRVLKPGGIFLGTVAFLEPFHDEGYYHHTHLGTASSLQYGGFKVDKLAPSEEWSALAAQASMGLFPRMPPMMSQAIVYPVQLLHKLWWKLGSVITRNPNASSNIRIRNTTGAFSFVASKSAS